MILHSGLLLKPADGIEGVKEAILTAVKDAGPNACPPMVVGVGIGGTFEKCAYLAKKALTRDLIILPCVNVCLHGSKCLLQPEVLQYV